jgi:hypothetical protein
VEVYLITLRKNFNIYNEVHDTILMINVMIPVKQYATQLLWSTVAKHVQFIYTRKWVTFWLVRSPHLSL